jgi:hypothetical protein
MNFDASNPDAESVQCAVCEKLITGGKWFSRIVRGEITVALCCPLCTETFQQNPAGLIGIILREASTANESVNVECVRRSDFRARTCDFLRDRIRGTR